MNKIIWSNYHQNFEIQQKIVEKIKAERTLVKSTKKLIQSYEQKTKTTIAKLWEPNE